jgi:hypothetical protein
VGASLWRWLPRGLQPGPDLFGLLEILVSGAPEEQAAGHTADGDGDVEVAGDRLEKVFMRVGVMSDPRWMRVASVDSDWILWRSVS